MKFDFMPDSYFVPGTLLHIKDVAFLLHPARPALQIGLYKGVIAGKRCLKGLVRNLLKKGFFRSLI